MLDMVVGPIFEKLVVAAVDHDQVRLVLQHFVEDRCQSVARVGDSATVDHLEGTLRGSRTPALETLLHLPSLTELHEAISARISVMDHEGRYVGTTFAGVTEEDLRDLSRFLAENDVEGYRKMFAGGRPREFLLSGLASGTYSLRIEVPGYAVLEKTDVRLEDGKTHRVELDLDNR